MATDVLGDIRTLKCPRVSREEMYLNILDMNRPSLQSTKSLSVMKPCVKCGASERYASGRCIPCRKCYRKENKEKVSKNNIQYKKDHAEKIIKRKSDWYKANSERILRDQSLYRKANSEKRARIIANWRKANPDKVHRDRVNYKKNNPGVIRAQRHTRRARKAGNGGTHTAKQWLELLASYHGLCVYCFGKATSRDHIIPIVNGGTNNIENIVPACNNCNDSKGSKSLLKWLVQVHDAQVSPPPS